ncbi:S-layer homology domain-containing protein [Paenibacillus sp. LS1]|uniref:S-layer homology domain-containing protein n=1 Tax=Paenibacillus sp. LS1 TaxID=2992120 RepID=UPI0039B6F1D2|nr:S-layer homology domain-containing protein [Paenibacillus sp. LS1]
MAILSSTAEFEAYDSIVSWTTESVDIVTQESVLGGYPGNKFLPKRELTREEAAQLIYNLIQSEQN